MTFEHRNDSHAATPGADGEELARRLRAAQDSGQALTATDSDLRLGRERGYTVQNLGQRLRADQARGIAGYKVGLTSADAQRNFQATEPVGGYLLADNVFDAGETVSDLIAPRVEAEVAFIMAAPLFGEDLEVDDVLAATAQIALSLEIVDSRWKGGAPSLGLLVADNVSAARAVIGHRIAADDVDLSEVAVSLTVGSLQATGNSRNVLGHPARAVAWLAQHLAHHSGQLSAGDLVLSGTLCPPTPIRPDEKATADFGALGQVTAVFGLNTP